MKAVIYYRVSTQDQNLENQRIRLLDYCKGRGWEVVNEYQDKISGLKDHRPGLDTLLQDARKRSFNVVVAVKLDRLGRSTKHLLFLAEELHHFNVDIALTDQPIDTTSSMGQMIFTILGAVAEFERSLIIERINAGLHRARKNGKKLGRKKKEISPEILEEIEDLRRSGWSYNKISKEMKIPKVTVYRILNSGPKSPPKKRGEFTTQDPPGPKSFDLETDEEGIL